MDGSNHVLFEVGIRNNNPIAKLIIERARIVLKCHGRIFQERKKKKAGGRLRTRCPKGRR